MLRKVLHLEGLCEGPFY